MRVINPKMPAIAITTIAKGDAEIIPKNKESIKTNKKTAMLLLKIAVPNNAIAFKGHTERSRR